MEPKKRAADVNDNLEKIQKRSR
ncbi:unnamed protein product, partial [Didymodactylos carnosus]